MVMLNTDYEDVSIPKERTFLDRAYDYLQSGEIGRARGMLFTALTRIRRHLNTREWNLYLSRVCLEHPVHTLIHGESVPAAPWNSSQGNTERKHWTGERTTLQRQGMYAEDCSCLLCRIADSLGERKVNG